MSLKLNISLFISILLLISGCTKVAVSPVEQVQQVQKTNSDNAEQVKEVAQRSVVKNQAMNLYLCKDDKEVRILKTKGKKNSISVTFMDTTHTLSPAVTKNGKKYSNIRWVWWEMRSGIAELYDNNKKVLAKECIKQR
ncbi:MAG: MliC family protein [Haemophilus parahaemolyticus]|uniref:MliC family protein n=1 Tax=Haemophilus parahaemolyticus TaxID=735 RepID=UPI0026EA915C|nr:MliC family protein [Haemophilus parahaemolyticus]MBS6008838.1 MliC family protein [Haemophilus parahaemolyticus]